MLENLKNLRKEFGFSQKQMAEKLCISQQTYSDYENGKTEPNYDSIIEICKIFNVTADYLLGLEDDLGARTEGQEKKPSTLSAEERRLVEGYREINTAGKKLVMQTVETLRNTAAGSGRGTENKIG